MEDRTRVIIALDADAFYASTILQFPENAHLANKPVGVYQKHIVVTTNYVARARGVAKMSSVDAARRACPDIVLFDGSDLAPFRRCAGKIRSRVAQMLPENTAVEYLGLDELFIDCTDAVFERKNDSAYPWKFEGNVYNSQVSADEEENGSLVAEKTRALQLASQLATEIRNCIMECSGVTFCAGIGESKLAAKLAAGIHKPNSQTCFTSATSVANFLSARPVTTIPGFGRGYNARLQAWAEAQLEAGEPYPDIQTVSGFFQTFCAPNLGVNALSIILRCSLSQADWILRACTGMDITPVKSSGAPTSISCEDAFRNCADIDAVARNLHDLSDELVERLMEDAAVHNDRRPGTLTVKFRFRGTGYKCTSRSVPMPCFVIAYIHKSDPSLKSKLMRAIADEALKVLAQNGITRSRSTFALSLLGVGASNFSNKPCFRGNLSKRKVLKRSQQVTLSGSSSLVSTESTSFGNEDNAVACPICNLSFGRNVTNYQVNQHIDKCIRSSHEKEQREPSPKKLRLTKQQTLRVDAFFSKTCRDRS